MLLSSRLSPLPLTLYQHIPLLLRDCFFSLCSVVFQGVPLIGDMYGPVHFNNITTPFSSHVIFTLQIR